MRLMAIGHILLWYTAIMSAKPVQVSIDLELLRRIDADPETREKGRSAFVRSAVSHYLDARRRRETDAAIRAAYGSAADDMQAEVTGLMDAQSWPRD
jgi:metal-responsive CopG/Arc/MetJ family transcriptional regulator